MTSDDGEERKTRKIILTSLDRENDVQLYKILTVLR